MKRNLMEKGVTTHQGAPAFIPSPEQELRRAVACCLLWEKSFYSDGRDIAERIAGLVPLCPPGFVADLAIQARDTLKLRHVPLLLLREMAKLPSHKGYVAQTLSKVIQRPDEIAEFMSLYWSAGKSPIAKQVKKGLAEAFGKFSEYQLAKHDYNSAKVRLRDVMFLVHAKPNKQEGEFQMAPAIIKPGYKRGEVARHLHGQGALYSALASDSLKTPDTWETALSAKADKRETFERLMAEKKLGALAFLRNLRGMLEANVPVSTIKAYGAEVNLKRVLPFRLLAAAKYAPVLEGMLYGMLQRMCAELPRISGHTVLLVDGSGSMDYRLSARSEMTRREAAIAMAMILAERCETFHVVAFSTDPWDIPERKGFDLRDAINRKVVPASTYLGKAVRFAQGKWEDADRIIVITDEQSHDSPPQPKSKGYIVNVSVERPSIAFGNWVSLSGFSESVLDFISVYEAEEAGKSFAEMAQPEEAEELAV